MDNQTCLILLDLSAIFDAVDHNLVIQHIHTNFGIRNRALDWVKSYLNERLQKVDIGVLGANSGATPKSVILTFGIPQGGILGPI